MYWQRWIAADYSYLVDPLNLVDLQSLVGHLDLLNLLRLFGPQYACEKKYGKDRKISHSRDRLLLMDNFDGKVELPTFWTWVTIPTITTRVTICTIITRVTYV